MPGSPDTLSFVNSNTPTTSARMYVKKRDGRQERFQFDKITARVSRLCYGLDMDHVDPVAITQKVISGVYGGVTTAQLDDLVSNALFR